MAKKVFCDECKIPMRKKRSFPIGEKRYFCPKCGSEKDK